MEEKRKAELYFVTSLYLNAYLLSIGFQMEKSAKLDNGKVALFYKNTDELHSEIAKYRENQELKGFVTQLRSVQNIIRIHKQRDMINESLTLEELFD